MTDMDRLEVQPAMLDKAKDEYSTCRDLGDSFEPSTKPLRRVALALRGGAFRKGFSRVQNRCGEGTLAVQEALWRSVDLNVVKRYEEAGAKVDSFVMTFPCSKESDNKLYLEQLRDWYKPKVLDVCDPEKEKLTTPSYTTQGRFAEGALRHVSSYSRLNNVTYDLVLLVRLDQMFHYPIDEMIQKNHHFNIHENLMGFPGCMLASVLTILHSGCVERAGAGDFGTKCMEEFKQVTEHRFGKRFGIIGIWEIRFYAAPILLILLMIFQRHKHKCRDM